MGTGDMERVLVQGGRGGNGGVLQVVAGRLPGQVDSLVQS